MMKSDKKKKKAEYDELSTYSARRRKT